MNINSNTLPKIGKIASVYSFRLVHSSFDSPTERTTGLHDAESKRK